MITKEQKKRLFELEKRAKSRFIENSDWNAVLMMLDKEERKEWEKLFKKWNEKQ